MSTVADPKKKPAPLSPEDPYRYGWRDEQVLQPDGTYKRQRIALTLEDKLHPHEGDYFVEGSEHDILCGYLRQLFRARLQNKPTALVLGNTGIYWDDPALGHHAPDVGVIFGLKRQQRNWPSFHVAKEGTRPRVLIELVSPLYRKTDVVDKFREYHQARVPIYIILDHEKDDDPWVIRAYRWDPQGYVPLPLAEDGRLWLEDLNLWLAVDGHNIRCFDGDTGEELGDYTAVEEKMRQWRARADAERVRAEAEKARAEAEKARAEAAETRLRDLEAELARLKGQPPTP